ncbi:unnamed protein product, partial [Mesorhabditis spiculigera]
MQHGTDSTIEDSSRPEPGEREVPPKRKGWVQCVTPGASAEEFWGHITPEQERHFRSIYQLLDIDHDGTLDAHDIRLAIIRSMPHIPSEFAERILKKMTPDEKATFAEFVRYADYKERKMREIFYDLDGDRDGQVDPQDIQEYSGRLGVPLSAELSSNMVQKISTGPGDNIKLKDFQKFMLFYPSNDPKELLGFWKRLTFDLGEDGRVPTDFTAEEYKQGIFWKHLLAGGIAGGISRTCTAPFDRIKIYLQVNSTKKNPLTLIKTTRVLYEEGKLKSFWRGNGINVAKIVPESALKFTFYEQIKSWIKGQSHEELTIPGRILAGSIAGGLSQTIIYPLELNAPSTLAVLAAGTISSTCGQLTSYPLSLIRTRLQGLNSPMVCDAHQPTTMVGQFKYIMRHEGPIGLYRGLAPNFLKVIPAVSISYAVYERVRSGLGAPST